MGSGAPPKPTRQAPPGPLSDPRRKLRVSDVVNAASLAEVARSVASIAWSAITGKPTTLSGYGITDGVSTSRTISTTAPLTGGGDLSANRTLAVSTMTGDSGGGGARGVVPAPAAGDAAAGKFLKADATWAVPGGGSGTMDHAALTSNLAWATSGHTGTASRLASFDGSGAASFTPIGSSGGVQSWDTDLDAYAALSTTGLVARTGSGTAATRTLTAGSARLTVTDGDGVAGNPTVTAGTMCQVDLYTTAGTTSGVTIPTWAVTARILCVGGGGGGASGRRAAAATNAMGGGGGTGGGYTDVMVSASALRALAATYSVTVGAGGTAGAAQTVDSTNGNPGGVGGASSFSVAAVNYAYAPGGLAGVGGTAASAGGVAATTWQWPSGAGGGPASSALTAGGSVFVGPGGGSGGGWLTSAGGRNDGTAGGAGGKARDNHTGPAGGTGGGAAGTAATAPVDGFSGDGGGSGAAGNAAGGDGGAGTRGGGGAGGGASRNGNNSGAGAVGGDGWIMILWT